MSRTFNNLQDLFKFIESEVKDSLQKDVANKVIEVEQEHIKSDVYFYEPKQYKRTGTLISKNSFEIKPIENGVSIRNITQHGGKDIPQVVEYGVDYDYTGYGYEYEDPRPFVRNTREEIFRDNIHIKALKKGLVNKGYKIR